MSIASRIQEIETHIEDVYDTINYSYDTTGINKNIINIPKYLKKGYIDIINNGIDTLYNNFPKVSGIGSNLSLTPTYEAPIKLNEIQGDTLQENTPTPDTPVPIQSVTGLQNVTISNADNTDSNTYEVNLGKNLFDNILQTQTINGLNVVVNEDGTILLNGTSTTDTYLNLTANFKLEKATYTMSSDYAMDTNIIRLILRQRTPNVTIASLNTGKSITFDNTYTDLVFIFLYIKSNQTFNNALIKPMIEKGSQATSYSPYFTPIELNKIGDYKDSIKKSTGKNLFDDTYNHLGMYQTATGQIGTFAEGNQYLGAYLKVEAGKTYSISRNKLTSRFAIGVTSEIPTSSTNCLAITRDDSTLKIENITIPDGYSYLILYLSNSSETSTGLNIMINEGTTALPYEPYGKVWYEEKQTGKVVLDGSETWITAGSNDITARFYTTSLTNNGAKQGLSSYFGHIGYLKASNTNEGFSLTTYSTYCYININKSRLSKVSANGITTWLSTHNTTVYYVLATPEYTEITNEELINQLEELYTAKSQEGTTNISITSEDLEMILNVSALKGEE